MPLNVGLIRTGWVGTSGGPGLTQLAFENATGDDITVGQAQAAVNAVRAFWDGIKSLLPNELTLTVSPVVDIYNYQDEELIGSFSAPTVPAAVTGTAAGNYAAGIGFKVNLNTGFIRYGRRVRGSIFVVPSDALCFTNTGVVASATKTTVNTAAATMLAAFVTAGCNLNVWSRPVLLPEERTGWLTVVQGIDTNEKSAILRGRRD
jgi:hypothetical protein